MDYKEIIKERLNMLSLQLRAFITNESWRGEVQKIGKKINLNEEKYALFENEVFLVLLCFEPKDDFTENIKREMEMDANMAGWIAEDVEKNVFSKVADEINSMWQTEGAESAAGAVNVESIESINNTERNEITENFIKSEQPERNKITEKVIGTESVRNVVNKRSNDETNQNFQSSVQPKNNVGQSFEQIILNQAKAMQPARPAAPEDLPIEQEKSKKIHDYVPGSDPYREPIE